MLLAGVPGHAVLDFPRGRVIFCPLHRLWAPPGLLFKGVRGTLLSGKAAGA